MKLGNDSKQAIESLALDKGVAVESMYWERGRINYTSSYTLRSSIYPNNFRPARC